MFVVNFVKKKLGRKTAETQLPETTDEVVDDHDKEESTTNLENVEIQENYESKNQNGSEFKS